MKKTKRIYVYKHTKFVIKLNDIPIPTMHALVFTLRYDFIKIKIKNYNNNATMNIINAHK